MRICLKVVVDDVRTGQWDLFSTAPIDDRNIGGVLSRASTDQGLVGMPKEKTHVAAADDFVKR